jgi:quercetin dioxygenase-like cupin family protein
MTVPYPELIENLPDVDLDVPGVKAKLLQADGMQMVFFEMDPIAQVPPHSHGDQWGVVIEGEVDLTVDGDTRRYKAGDTYTIPAGAVHSASFPVKSKLMDLFADPDRYRPKK